MEALRGRMRRCSVPAKPKVALTSRFTSSSAEADASDVARRSVEYFIIGYLYDEAMLAMSRIYVRRRKCG